MQSVARWGNSLAVRIPARIVKAMGLKPGDRVELQSKGERVIEVAPEMTREQALADIRAMRWKLPEGYKFDRDEANSRHHD